MSPTLDLLKIGSSIELQVNPESPVDTFESGIKELTEFLRIKGISEKISLLANLINQFDDKCNEFDSLIASLKSDNESEFGELYQKLIQFKRAYDAMDSFYDDWLHRFDEVIRISEEGLKDDLDSLQLFIFKRDQRIFEQLASNYREIELNLKKLERSLSRKLNRLKEDHFSIVEIIQSQIEELMEAIN
ncbi:hypothetical protein ACFL21_03370 [Patescibacteria group bacterium]